MLLCRKVTRLGFDVRYSPKHIFTVSTLAVDPVLVPNSKGGKVSDMFCDVLTLSQFLSSFHMPFGWW